MTDLAEKFLKLRGSPGNHPDHFEFLEVTLNLKSYRDEQLWGSDRTGPQGPLIVNLTFPLGVPRQAGLKAFGDYMALKSRQLCEAGDKFFGYRSEGTEPPGEKLDEPTA